MTILANTNKQKGQALITLLFFVIIGITLMTAASFVVLENVSSSSSAEDGNIAYFAAESGIEDGLLLYLRYPTTYTGGTTTYSQGQATVTLNTSGNTVTFTSKGQYSNATRTITVTETNGSNGWQITSWQEQ